MSETIIQSIYFDQPGKANTARTLKIAKQRADELGMGVCKTSGSR